MNKLCILLVLSCISTYSQMEELTLKQERFTELISIYQDSLRINDGRILELEKADFERLLKEGTLVMYSKFGGELNKKPFTGVELIKKLPVNTKLVLLSKVRSFWEVKTIYGTGFLSNIYVKDSPNATTTELYSSSLTNDKPSKKSTYRRSSNSTSRRYIRGSRGGCYYINSNGNKTYVDRSKC